MEEVKRTELKVQDLWNVFRSCWILLLAIVVLVTGGSYLVLNQLYEPEYTATVTIWALRVSPDSLTSQDVSIGTNLINDYRLLIKDDAVVRSVIQKTSMDDNNLSIERLKNAVTIKNETGTRVLYLSVTAKTPGSAQTIANAWGEAFCEQVNNSIGEEQSEEGNQQKTVKIFSKAYLPTTPSNQISIFKLLLIGVAVAVLAYAIALIRFVLNDRLITPEDVENYLGLHVLGMIPDKDELTPRRYTPSVG